MLVRLCGLSDGIRWHSALQAGLLRRARAPSTRTRRGALHEFNTLVFAADQEPHHRDVHQGDLAQTEDFTYARGSNSSDIENAAFALEIPYRPVLFALVNMSHFRDFLMPKGD